jgi:hypothetical protein
LSCELSYTSTPLWQLEMRPMRLSEASGRRTTAADTEVKMYGRSTFRASITIGGKKTRIAVEEREIKRERGGRLVRRPLKPAETRCAVLCRSCIGSICYGTIQCQWGPHPPARGGALLQPGAGWIIRPALSGFVKGVPTRFYHCCGPAGEPRSLDPSEAPRVASQFV